MTKAKTDIIYGCLAGAIAAVFFTITLTFPSRSGGVNPRVFPLVVTVSTFVLSILLIGEGVLRLTKERRIRDTGTEKGKPLSRNTACRLGLLAAAGFAYTITVEALGYLVATPLLIAAAMVLFQARKWYEVLLFSVVASLIFYYLFRMVFRVPLPRSIFW